MLKKAGKFIEHIACTACPSSDAMAVYQQEDDTYDATCFKCGHYERNPYGEGIRPVIPGAADAIVVEMLTLNACSECPALPLTDRGITLETTQFYGVKCLVNGADGVTPVAHLYPYHKNGKLVGYKKRVIENKRFSTIGDCKQTDLFGQHLFEEGGKKVYITEGECDALALFQTFKSLAGVEFKHLNPAVVSLPSGANSVAACLERSRSFLSKFQEVVLVFDQDDAGEEATRTAFSVLDPTTTRVARLTEKDANAMLLAGKANELKWACLNATPYTPSGIATVNDLIEAATTLPTLSDPWPWPSLTRLTYGRYPGLYGIGAGVGVGKTEWFHELAWYIAHEQRQPVGLFFLEEAPSRSLRILGGRTLGLPVHRPDVSYDREQLYAAIQELDGRVFTFDHRGERTWDNLHIQLKYLIMGRGIRDIFLDPLTAIISHSENTDRFLHAIMDDLSRLTHDPYNARIYYSSHLNEPPRDRTSHEEGGRVTESQFAGSRAMARYSDYLFGLERNKQDPDIVERNTTTFRVLKDRKFGSATGETFRIFYDHNTGRYLEAHNEF